MSEISLRKDGGEVDGAFERDGKWYFDIWTDDERYGWARFGPFERESDAERNLTTLYFLIGLFTGRAQRFAERVAAQRFAERVDRCKH